MREFENEYLDILSEQVENYVKDHQVLFLITGVPGSGKTTLANKIKSQYESLGLEIPKHFEADMWFEKDGQYKWFKEGLKDAHNWCQNSVKSALEAGKTVIVSNTSINTFARRPYIKIAHDLNIPIKYIELDGGFKNVHNVPDEIVNKMKESYIPISKDELNLFTEQISKNKIIEEIDRVSLQKMIDNHIIVNENPHGNLENIRKHLIYKDDLIHFFILKEGNYIAAIAIIKIIDNICDIMELLSLRIGYGYGSYLIKHFIEKPFKLIYLVKNWEANDELLNIYRNKKFGFKEYVSQTGKHWFYKNRMITFDEMNKFKLKYFI